MRTICLLLIAGLSACAGTAPDPEPELLPAQELEITVPSEALSLEGTLALPARLDSELIPAAVLVHGSGPNSRDAVASGQLNMSFGGLEIAAFRDISQALSDDGIAVLRYDKRSCTAAGGYCDNDYPLPGADLVVSDFAEDALAAVTWLGEQDFVDPQRIFIVGHSQGAALVPKLLADNPLLAAGVSLAGNYRPIDALLGYQLDFSRGLMLAAGYPQSAIDEQLASLTGMVDDLAALRQGSFSGAQIGGASIEFWLDWLAIGDARPGLIAAEERPILAINGDYDWNIPHDPELLLWADAGIETQLLSCVTHALNCVEGSEIGGTVDPTLLQNLGEWLLAI